MNSFGTIVGNDTILFERLLPASIENVWEYLTKPAFLARWLADASIDCREGGALQLFFNISDADDRERPGSVIAGRVLRYTPPYALEISWTDGSTLGGGDGARLDSRVSFELKPHYDEVLLTLRHAGLPAALRHTWTAGWHTHLDILSARMRNEKPESFLLAYRRLLRTYVDRAAALQSRL